MIPLGAEATDAVLGRGDGLHRAVALRHAALHGRPGLWGDHPSRPSSVLWLRPGDGCSEVFGAGRAGPALDWLDRAGPGRPVVLAAPPGWEDAVRARLGPAVGVARGLVATWLRPEAGDLPPLAVDVRRLDEDDAAAFDALAPPGALRSWGDFAALLDRGAAFGVPGRAGLASVAWVVESDRRRVKVGVATDPRFHRLGLGRAAASALVEWAERGRGKSPLWVADAANTASLGLARALGFAPHGTEILLRWTP